MFYCFAVGIYKISGVLGTHAFKLFAEYFNVFRSPTLIMTGNSANTDVVVHGFLKFFVSFIIVNTLAEIKKIKDLKAPFAVFFH